MIKKKKYGFDKPISIQYLYYLAAEMEYLLHKKANL